MIYAMSDFHLPSKLNKTMDMFGWGDHIKKIEDNWNLSEDDTIIIPGDLSWGLNADDIIPDLEWLSKLPGTKVVSKGNHDLWWNSKNKVQNLFNKYGIKIIQNDSINIEGISICATRGWDITLTDDDSLKILNREVIRMKLSLESATEKEKIAFMHYPPILINNDFNKFHELFLEYGISKVYYGHIHGNKIKDAIQEKDGIIYTCVASDQINFAPIKVP